MGIRETLHNKPYLQNKLDQNAGKKSKVIVADCCDGLPLVR